MAERALPWLLCLPALLFATPLSPLVDDPYPHLAGTGWAVLGLVPLALFVLVRGASARGAWPFVLALAWALVSWRAASVTDTFEARRALLVLCILPLALAGGAALTARGRATFLALCVGLSCGWTGWALWSGFTDGNFAGVLGDTGSLSQAALGGAAAGAVWAAREGGARRALGALALGLFLVHVAAAPVLAGSHTLLAGLLLAAWRGPARGRGALVALAAAALLSPFVGLAAREWATGKPPASVEGAPEQPAHSLGGLGVRGLVWKASLGLVADHPLVGAGPGQFQAAFPPYRDPREIELSRHGVCSELDTEVEHAHNDWLQAFCEIGLPGGLLFTLGLALAARAALRGLRDEGSVAAAVAALALLVNALVHAPLFANPASSVLALALLGTLPGVRPDPARAWTGAALALPALAGAFFAPGPIAHGWELRRYVRALKEMDALSRQIEEPQRESRFSAALERARTSVLAALEAAPDSAPARLLLSNEDLGIPLEDESCLPSFRLDFGPWRLGAVLAVRPHSVEAWERSALESAGRFQATEASARFSRALALSPTQPRILRNAARLELTLGEPGSGLEHIATLREHGCLDPAWLEALGAELVLDWGRPGDGARLLFDRPLEELSPEELHARSREAGPLAEAEECLAQLLWARQHAATGAFEVALRNYRQARDRSQVSRAVAAPLYALELAAAERRAGRDDEAREHARGVSADLRTWTTLPEWARAALAELGLGPGAER